jgi:hypothetical protein
MPADVQQFASRRDRVQVKLRTDIGLRSVRQQVDEWVQRAAGHSSKDAIRDVAEALKEKLTAIDNEWSK